MAVSRSALRPCHMAFKIMKAPSRRANAILSRLQTFLNQMYTFRVTLVNSDLEELSIKKRGHLVRLRTSLILSFQNILARNVGAKMKTTALKAAGELEIHLADKIDEIFDMYLGGLIGCIMRNRQLCQPLTEGVYGGTLGHRI
jgi:hypothetical protein